MKATPLALTPFVPFLCLLFGEPLSTRDLVNIDPLQNLVNKECSIVGVHTHTKKGRKDESAVFLFLCVIVFLWCTYTFESTGYI